MYTVRIKSNRNIAPTIAIANAHGAFQFTLNGGYYELVTDDVTPFTHPSYEIIRNPVEEGPELYEDGGGEEDLKEKKPNRSRGRPRNSVK